MAAVKHLVFGGGEGVLYNLIHPFSAVMDIELLRERQLRSADEDQQNQPPFQAAMQREGAPVEDASWSPCTVQSFYK